MKRFGFKDFIIKPLFLSILTFFIIFFFFPSFSNEYLNVGFSASSDSVEKVEGLSDEIKEKTGDNVDDLLDELNTDKLSDLINSVGD
ncbi:MAG: hypothetical protein ACPKM0_10310 [Pleomorphochaeta sp.]